VDLTTDRDGFDGVVRRHQGMVFSLARHILGDEAEAEEVAQEVFCKLFQHAADVESEAHLLHWLRQVATRQALDRWRRRRVRPRLGLEDIAEPAAPALPTEQRAVVALRYQEDLDPREIAALMGQSVHTIKSRLQRALRVLRAATEAAEKKVVAR
jgi:RNA polymerase sigma-70 factor, ECF subfamily